ncbi:hypothetical protein B0H14DRAFT_3465953 [Mycena olivaceomarginata]|nr:hypothetical protein B0H14DRAFT_3465953 [Mycena olivaceomarginata]
MHCTLPPPQCCAWSRNSIASVPPAACVLLFAAVPATVADPAAPSHMLCCVSTAVLFIVCPRSALLAPSFPPCTLPRSSLPCVPHHEHHGVPVPYTPAPPRMRSPLYAHRRTGMQRWRITRRAATDDEARVEADGDVDEHMHSLLADLNADVLTQIDASTYGPVGQRRVQMPVEESFPHMNGGSRHSARPAPDVPYTRGELRDIFQFFFRQLTNGFKASNSP